MKLVKMKLARMRKKEDRWSNKARMRRKKQERRLR